MSSARPDRWIQPDHLAQERAAAYRGRRDPAWANLLVLDDFLVPSLLARIHAYAEEEAAYERQYHLYSENGLTDAERWAAAADADRFFTFEVSHGPKAACRMSANWLHFLTFCRSLSTPPVKHFFEQVAGERLGAVQSGHLHRHGPNDFLRAHADTRDQRQLCGVLYLSPAWQPTYGGAFCMEGPAGTIKRVDAVYNRLLLFDPIVTARHYVEPHRPDAGTRPRLSFVFWYQVP